MPTTLPLLRDALQQAKDILVVTHVGPDGDALGSLTAVGQLLQQAGKSFTLMCDDNLPRRFDYLPLYDQIVMRPDPALKFDLTIAVDCGDALRMGTHYPEWLASTPRSINIDHHITNTNYADFNIVNGTATSTTEMLYQLIIDLDFTLNTGLATSLLTGLVTDTLGFRIQSVTPRTMQIASDLMSAGGDLPMITERALNLKPLSTLQLWQVGLAQMQMDDGLAWTAVSYEQRQAIGHHGDSSHGLVNLLADIETAAMGMVLLEMDNGSVRVGFRCRPPYNVADIALAFGGGGHALAAGCTMHGPLNGAASILVNYCKEAIQEQREQAANG